MSETGSLSVTDEGLPDDLETLVVLAKMIGVVPNITNRIDKFGKPLDGDMRWMFEVSIKHAIKHAIENELKQRERG